MKILFIVSLFIVSVRSFSKLPEGKLDSPFLACKNELIVSDDKYRENKDAWEKLEKKCDVKVQIAEDAGVSKLDPLKEGIKYLDFTQKVASKVLVNLEKSKTFAECSKKCFEGARVCYQEQDGKGETVNCEERRETIKNSLTIYSTKIRMEMALANDAPGILNVNVKNILNVEKEKRINVNLRDFDLTVTPNPLNGVGLTEREKKEALRRLDMERKYLEDEAKRLKIKNYSEWMSVKLMQKMEEHQVKYRALIYEEAPIFSVIEKPLKFVRGSEPVFSDEQIAKAFKKLMDNAEDTKQKVKKVIAKGKLEFNRGTGEAFYNWIKNDHDLLFFMGFKNQVEETLAEDKKLCAAATTLNERVFGKEMQNLGLTVGAAFVGAPVIKGTSTLLSRTFNLTKALTGAQASALSGLSMGYAFLGDSFYQYSNETKFAASRSGLSSNNEGSSLSTAEKIENAKNNLVLNTVLARAEFAAGWALGKTLYHDLAKVMEKDLPALEKLSKRARLDNSSRDILVDRWMFEKVKNAIRKGLLSEEDKLALQSDKAANVMDVLANEITKKRPNFFKNPENINLFFKAASTTLKREKDDPEDLGLVARNILLNLNPEALAGNWSKEAENGMLKLYNATIKELRLTYKNDPALYLKFQTDKGSQEVIMMNALKKSGVLKEEEARYMYQCAIKK